MAGSWVARTPKRLHGFNPLHQGLVDPDLQNSAAIGFSDYRRGVCFHIASGSYAVAAASTACFRIKEPNPDIYARDGNAPTGADQPVISEHKRLELSAASAPLAIACHRVDLVSFVTWETIESHALDANEYITAKEMLTLDAAQAATGCKQFLCLATTFVLGEDVASHGKMYVFDVVDVVPLPGRPQTNHKLHLLYQEEIQRLLSALAEQQGQFCCAVGIEDPGVPVWE
ncbi:mRNA cleavage and polyadenylation factor subunit [Coemansia pectinata]|uniref:mRNA cleavage and polyadenylation factor subunit n=1 Tax=Coemansia pectinata TaxID=1052879 RepID=A0A9W8LCB3_9FUNG|nr:mRNA cleavage and polyadenylation factor subunit [Coemansia pectinata]